MRRGLPAGRWCVGALLAGAGLTLTVWQGTLLLLPVVELRNGRVTAVEVTKQVSTVVGIAVLVAAGASLTPFFAVPIAVGRADRRADARCCSAAARWCCRAATCDRLAARCCASRCRWPPRSCS